MTGGPLLVACALRAEAWALRPALRRTPARLLRTGMGPERSGRAVRGLLGAFEDSAAVAPAAAPSPDAAGAAFGALAVTGFCAAVRPGIRPGDVLLADAVRDDRGEAAGADRLPALDRLADALRTAGLTVHTGPLHSADRVVRGAPARAALAEGGALGADMETAAALRAAPAGLPAAALRVVVDTPEHELLGLNTLTGGFRAWRALGALPPALAAWHRAVTADGIRLS